jgi:hypothetical protein
LLHVAHHPCGWLERRRPILHSHLILSQTSAGKTHWLRSASAAGVLPGAAMTATWRRTRSASYDVERVLADIDADHVAEGHHFPGFKAEACAALKILGLDAVRDESFPRVVIFSGGKRFEVRPDYQAERAIRTIKGEGGGDFRITEWLGERRKWPWSRKRSYTLRILGPANIGITEGKITTRFGKCSTISPSL